MKHLKTFENYVNELADYTNDRYPIDMKTVDVSPVDRKDINDLDNDAKFQRIQGKMQNRLKKKLQQHNPNAENQDVIQASDRFLDGNSIGPEKKKKIKNIVDDTRLTDDQKAKRIINQGKKEVTNNYYRSDNGDVSDEFHPE